MRFLVDENVRKEVIAFLREAGHDVMRAPRSTANGLLFALIQQESRILITHDKDFSNVKAYPPERTPGIMCLRVDPAINDVVIDALRRVLASVPAERLVGRLLLVEPTGIIVWPD